MVHTVSPTLSFTVFSRKCAQIVWELVRVTTNLNRWDVLALLAFRLGFRVGVVIVRPPLFARLGFWWGFRWQHSQALVADDTVTVVFYLHKCMVCNMLTKQIFMVLMSSSFKQILLDHYKISRLTVLKGSFKTKVCIPLFKQTFYNKKMK